MAVSAMSVPCAYAQSSVTLVGIIDAGITYFSNLNGHGTFVANDGSIQSNRWGGQAAKILAAVSGGAAAVSLGGAPAPVFSNGLYVGSGDSSTAIQIGMRTRPEADAIKLAH
ncbi:hypothetical protein LJR034_004367 [Caballeronia sp. LjRoot34]